jgi:signal peptidase I
VLFVGIVFLAISVTQSYAPSDASMQPELQSSQHVLVNKAAYIFAGPSRGEVVLVADPSNTSLLLLRRVVGVPGDTIQVNAVSVIVNGVPLNESSYTGIANGSSESSVAGTWKLGANQYFVLADSRFSGEQSDSRAFGPVSRSNILGRAELVYWPVKDFHWVDSHSDVYSKVPSR